MVSGGVGWCRGGVGVVSGGAVSVQCRGLSGLSVCEDVYALARAVGAVGWPVSRFFSRATANFIFIFFLFLKLKLRFFARFFLPPATIFQNFAKAVSLRGG